MRHIEYEHRRQIGETVRCPDGSYLKFRWLTSTDSVLGVQIVRGSDPKSFTGTGSWYQLDELGLLGEGNIMVGLVVVGRAHYVIPERELIGSKPRLMYQEIDRLKHDDNLLDVS